MIRCCRRARVADAGKDEELDKVVKLAPILASGCVTTASISESDPAGEDAAVLAVAVAVLKQLPFSRSARWSIRSSEAVEAGVMTCAARVRATMPPTKHEGADVGGTRSHWYCSWFWRGSPERKSKPHFLLRTSFWAASSRSMNFLESSLSTGPNRSRLTRAAVMRAVAAGRLPIAGERSVDISDSINGLYTLALMITSEKNPCLFFTSFKIFCCCHTHNKTRFYFSSFRSVSLDSVTTLNKASRGLLLLLLLALTLRPSYLYLCLRLGSLRNQNRCFQRRKALFTGKKLPNRIHRITAQLFAIVSPSFKLF